MNVIIYKSLFHNTDLWNANGNIIDILLRTLHADHLSLKTILFSSLLHTPKSSVKKSKLNIFYSNIWKHIFLNDSQKEEFLDIFSNMQRTYYGFSRFARIYKYRHASISVNSDLYLNPLDPKHPRTCVFFIYKSIYYFNVFDLWKMMEKAWTNQSDFYLELHMPKNPYTNISFTKTELYHYYFHRIRHGFSIPLLLEFMFQCGFELQLFEVKYESFLYKYIIRRHVFESPPNSRELFHSCIDMIDENQYTNKWDIHSDFPRDKLVEIMRPYLYFYYLILHGKLTENQFLYFSSLLYNSLHLFWNFNPKFGMKNQNSESSFYDAYLPIKTRHL